MLIVACSLLSNDLQPTRASDIWKNSLWIFTAWVATLKDTDEATSLAAFLDAVAKCHTTVDSLEISDIQYFEVSFRGVLRVLPRLQMHDLILSFKRLDFTAEDRMARLINAVSRNYKLLRVRAIVDVDRNYTDLFARDSDEWQAFEPPLFGSQQSLGGMGRESRTRAPTVVAGSTQAGSIGWRNVPLEKLTFVFDRSSVAEQAQTQASTVLRALIRS